MQRGPYFLKPQEWARISLWDVSETRTLARECDWPWPSLDWSLESQTLNPSLCIPRIPNLSQTGIQAATITLLLIFWHPTCFLCPAPHILAPGPYVSITLLIYDCISSHLVKVSCCFCLSESHYHLHERPLLWSAAIGGMFTYSESLKKSIWGEPRGLCPPSFHRCSVEAWHL